MTSTIKAVSPTKCNPKSINTKKSSYLDHLWQSVIEHISSTNSTPVYPNVEKKSSQPDHLNAFLKAAIEFNLDVKKESVQLIIKVTSKKFGSLFGIPIKESAPTPLVPSYESFYHAPIPVACSPAFT